MATRCIEDFKIVHLKTSSDSIISHTLYVKQHTVREENKNKPGDRTLFILNVPPFVDENFLTELYSKAGKVSRTQLCDKPTSNEKNLEDVLFHEKPKVGYKVAYVVFENPNGLKKALQIEELKPTENSPKINSGIAKFIKDYNDSIPNIKYLKEKINLYMENYDRQMKEKLENEKALTEADDEGWITVTKQSKRPGFERKESVANKIAKDKLAHQEKKELKNFYTFQIRESKMNHIITLRQKFEEDKKKIALLKQSRRFKPF